ncbi:MAG TPA: chitobiase/beta-hexosaminidase C-terminal domain-containing protein, partial [Kofleriaceae bacterium]
MWGASLLLAIAMASGCHIAFPIEPFDDEGVGPRVFSSPGPAPFMWGGFAEPVGITLAAADPDTTIYYTLDGSMPTEASANGTTPVGPITIGATSLVRYFGAAAGETGSIDTEEFVIAPAPAMGFAGYRVTNTTLDGTSPVVTAPAGATLAARADIQVWVQGDCETCT